MGDHSERPAIVARRSVPGGLPEIAAFLAVVMVMSAAMSALTVVALVPTGFDVLAPSSRSRGVAVLGDSVQRAATRVLASMVALETTVGFQSFEGSGVVLRSDGLILTNNHVVVIPDQLRYGMGAVSSTATLADGRTAPFVLVAGDPVSDVAVVRIQGVSSLPPIDIGTSTDLTIGQEVIAVGSPLGMAGSVTTGIVSALHRPVSSSGGIAGDDTVLDAIQTDAAINPGSSGGALVDKSGALVGLIAALASTGGDYVNGPGGSIGLGFAIPVEQAIRVADQLISTGAAVHASLGVQTVDSGPAPGAKVVAVDPKGPAAAAGVPPGALLTEVDGRVLATAESLAAYVLSKQPGDSIAVTYRDPSGPVETVRVILGVQ